MRKLRLGIVLMILSVLPCAAQTELSQLYVRPQPVDPADSTVHLDQVVVTALRDAWGRVAAPVSNVSQNNVFYHSSTNIVDAVTRQGGIHQMTTGGAISKPVIRGLGSTRVLVLNEGVRQEGQQWGDDHGVELDSHNVGNVEIVKGPGALVYGTDALAGVIMFNGEPLPVEGVIGTRAEGEFQSVSGLLNYSVRNAGNMNGFVWRARWSQSFAHDYKAPKDGFVPGTRYAERSFNALVGASRNWGHSHLKLSYFHQTPGMIRIGEGEAAELEPREQGLSYRRLLPFQEVGHYRVTSDNLFYTSRGTVKAILSYQYNSRREYEESADRHEMGIGTGTASYDIRYNTGDISGWIFQTGVQGMFQHARNSGGERLIPDYSMNESGAFLTVDKHLWDRLHLGAAVRYDYRYLDSGPSFRGEPFIRSFSGVSANIGALYNVSRVLDLRLNLARGSRSPNISELASDGMHEGTLRYEVGNPDLKQEHNLQVDAGLDLHSLFVDAAVSLYYNKLDNFIHLRRMLLASDPSPREAYGYCASYAVLAGGEATLALKPDNRVNFSNTFSYVRGWMNSETTVTENMPMIPAPRLLSTVHYEVPQFSNVLTRMCLEVEADINFKQSHCFEDFETPADAYTLFNAGISGEIRIGDRSICMVNLMCGNIFNKAYIPHLSRLRYVDASHITGHQGLYNPGRNFTLKFRFDF